MKINFNLYLENNKINKFWYHGSKVKIDKFNLNYVGTGNDEYGIGIYFANNRNSIWRYGNTGTIHEVKIKTYENIWQNNNNKITKKFIKSLLDFSDNYIDNDLYINWDENKIKAEKLIINTYLSHNQMNFFQPMFYNDFYFGYPKSYMKALVALKCDGYIVDVGNSIEFLVLHNPNIIEINSYEELI